MKTIAPPANATNGFDESKFQTDITWPIVNKTQTYVQLKATQGETTVDPMFQVRWKLAFQSGMRRIAYLFGNAGQDPQTQAQHFYNTVTAQGPLGDFDGIMFDWEASGLGLAEGLAIINACEALFGRKMIIYGSSYYLQALHIPPEYADRPLAVAEYGSHAPLVPAPWLTPSFWQWTGNGRIQGINTPVDQDLFYGAPQDLDVLLKSLIAS